MNIALRDRLDAPLPRLRPTAPGLPCFVINLDRSQDRFRRIGAHLADLGIAFARVPAIDGAALGPGPWPNFDERAFNAYTGRPAMAGDYGCYLSHLRAYEAFLQTDAPFALILEDDALLAPDARMAIAGLARLGRHWDLVLLGGNHKGMPLPLGPVCTGHDLAVMRLRYTGAFAYLINRRAAEGLLRHLLPMRMPLDHAFDGLWKHGVRLRALTPPVAVTSGETASTISPAKSGGGRVYPKFPWWKRGSVLVYRTGADVRRLMHFMLRPPSKI